jgi:hypothetical protein
MMSQEQQLAQAMGTLLQTLLLRRLPLQLLLLA